MVQGCQPDATEADVLAYMDFPSQRRADVVGVFPNDGAVVRLIGALLLEQNDEWPPRARYMTLEAIVLMSDTPLVRMSELAD